MVDSSKWEVIEAGSSAARQGHGQLDFVEEGEDCFRQKPAPSSSTARGGVMPSTSRAGRDLPRQDRNLPARLRHLVGEVGCARGHHLRPNILTVATAWRSTTTTRSTHHATAGSRPTCSMRRSAGESRTSRSASAATTRSARRCTPRSCTNAIAAGMGHWHRECGMLEVYEEIEPELRSWSRTSC